jgi:hypothetical protein
MTTWKSTANGARKPALLVAGMMFGDFSPTTARSWVGDENSRRIEARARADADKGVEAYATPERTGITYQGQVLDEMAAVIYREQFTRRLQRNQRKAKSVQVTD